MAQSRGRSLTQPVFFSGCPLQGRHTHGVRTETPIRPAWPLFYVQHASLNFSISPAMFMPFSSRQVDAAGQIKNGFLQKMHSKCGEPSARSERRSQHLPHVSGRHKQPTALLGLLITNTKAASKISYKFKHCTLFLVFSALLSLLCHSAKSKREHGLCWGSEGDGKGAEA